MPVFVTPGSGGGGGGNSAGFLFVSAGSFTGNDYTPLGDWSLALKTPKSDFNIFMYDGGVLLKDNVSYTFNAGLGKITLIGGATDILIQRNN